ncbi:hypothetical protein EDB81DRAFT_811658 [Dactylonectria macrodidyma]|uniref:Uncharacterized protein n=1 Tax=Dactylonectria macrodidyma TaxID=307937 RepID=A0A9P9DS73_9HYPO|nr:hypothetical protein EDB81DRAFT_811658 [Dactylonectria macrodidyma]
MGCRVVIVFIVTPCIRSMLYSHIRFISRRSDDIQIVYIISYYLPSPTEFLIKTIQNDPYMFNISSHSCIESAHCRSHLLRPSPSSSHRLSVQIPPRPHEGSVTPRLGVLRENMCLKCPFVVFSQSSALQ